jgi:hypothetical protein
VSPLFLFGHGLWRLGHRPARGEMGEPAMHRVGVTLQCPHRGGLSIQQVPSGSQGPGVQRCSLGGWRGHRATVLVVRAVGGQGEEDILQCKGQSQP